MRDEQGNHVDVELLAQACVEESDRERVVAALESLKPIVEGLSLADLALVYHGLSYGVQKILGVCPFCLARNIDKRLPKDGDAGDGIGEPVGHA